MKFLTAAVICLVIQAAAITWIYFAAPKVGAGISQPFNQMTTAIAALLVPLLTAGLTFLSGLEQAKLQARLNSQLKREEILLREQVDLDAVRRKEKVEAMKVLHEAVNELMNALVPMGKGTFNAGDWESAADAMKRAGTAKLDLAPEDYRTQWTSFNQNAKNLVEGLRKKLDATGDSGSPQRMASITRTWNFNREADEVIESHIALRNIFKSWVE